MPLNVCRRLAGRFFSHPAAFLLAAIAVVTGFPAAAEDLSWIIKSVSEGDDGEMLVATRQLPQVGSVLVTGQQLSTGGAQHVVLINGRDRVEIRPNSTIAIGDSDGGATTINVISGTIHVELRQFKPGEDFSILAPSLIAIGQDAKFSVSASNQESVVSVTYGKVAVSATATGQSIDVTAGYSAIVRRQPQSPQ